MKQYTANQVADRLRFAKSTIRVYIMQGKIKATKFGRDWMISQNELDRLLKGRK